MTEKKAQYYHGINTNNLEFGGPWGAFALIAWSHYILLYFWYCYEVAEGSLVIPFSMSELMTHLGVFSNLLFEKGIPSNRCWIAYFFFFIIQIVLAAYMPGLTMYGLPTAPHGKRLAYHCNGYLSYYFSLFLLFVLHNLDLFRITEIIDNFGEYLLASIIIGDVTSLFWYFYGILFTKDSKTGILIYDYFMGTILYPRITFLPKSYEVDIKMIAEVRWSWLTLMILTTSCCVKQYELYHYITKEMCIIAIAHWLYSNATVKGEQYIPCTTDMFHENFGWMLNFWNVSGVPFLYCFQSKYILKHSIQLTNELSNAFAFFVFLLLLLGYYCFDTSNCQKCSNKVQGIKRNIFPQLPWAILNPDTAAIRYIATPHGNLLVDGWYAHVRKMQYTGDIIMALSWALACGFHSLLPYFYPLFFTCMIVHRQSRDEVRCKEKYGKYWDVYVKEVPNVFLPSLKFYIWLLKKDKSLPPVPIPPELLENSSKKLQ